MFSIGGTAGMSKIFKSVQDGDKFLKESGF